MAYFVRCEGCHKLQVLDTTGPASDMPTGWAQLTISRVDYHPGDTKETMCETFEVCRACANAFSRDHTPNKWPRVRRTDHE